MNCKLKLCDDMILEIPYRQNSEKFCQNTQQSRILKLNSSNLCQTAGFSTKVFSASYQMALISLCIENGGIFQLVCLVILSDFIQNSKRIVIINILQIFNPQYSENYVIGLITCVSYNILWDFMSPDFQSSKAPSSASGQLTTEVGTIH